MPLSQELGARRPHASTDPLLLRGTSPSEKDGLAAAGAKTCRQPRELAEGGGTLPRRLRRAWGPAHSECWTPGLHPDGTGFCGEAPGCGVCSPPRTRPHPVPLCWSIARTIQLGQSAQRRERGASGMLFSSPLLPSQGDIGLLPRDPSRTPQCWQHPPTSSLLSEQSRSAPQIQP